LTAIEGVALFAKAVAITLPTRDLVTLDRGEERPTVPRLGWLRHSTQRQPPLVAAIGGRAIAEPWSPCIAGSPQLRVLNRLLRQLSLTT
jgi:hypothetical protein